DDKEGWLNTNYFSQPPVDGAIYFDALESTPDMLNQFDFILVNHMLCTMKEELAIIVLSNAYSWLKEGGVIHVIDMDLLKMFEHYQKGDADLIPIEQGDIDSKLCNAISGYGTRLSLYTRKHLENLLLNVGFRSVVQLDTSKYDTRPNESLIVEATK